MKIKVEADGGLRYKSRLVAKGFADKNFYNRSEIYAPVARLSDVTFVLIVGNKYNLELKQFDIKAAFLNGSLQKAVYMEIPEGLKERVMDRYTGERLEENYVCKLHGSLYGLKVSPKRWFVRFREVVKSMRFEQYPFQPCLFKWRDGDNFAILLLYVDDILFTTNSETKMREVQSELTQHFEVTDLGEPKKFLGLQIERCCEKRTIWIHQERFIRSILKRFDLDNDRGRIKKNPMNLRDAVRKVTPPRSQMRSVRPLLDRASAHCST